MKKYSFVLLVTFTMLVACSERNEKSTARQFRQKSMLSSNPVDSIFNIHLALLDSIAAGKRFNEPLYTDRIMDALSFMEEITSIPSGAEYTFVGPAKIPTADVIKWKKWYSENKSHLMWDEQTKSIFKIDDWREQAKYVNFVDSVFSVHFAILDTVANGKVKEVYQPFKSKVTQSILFMQDITGIPSNADFSYLSPSPIPKDTITRWKNWYSENKPYLKWNPTLKTMVRIQK